jgi:hypothetical protein
VASLVTTPQFSASRHVVARLSDGGVDRSVVLLSRQTEDSARNDRDDFGVPLARLGKSAARRNRELCCFRITRVFPRKR